METHAGDPIDPETPPSDPWERLNEQVASLTVKLRQQYESIIGSDGPTEEEVKVALRTLWGAWDRVMEAMSTAAKDDEVRRAVKKATSTFAEALGSALSEAPMQRDQPAEEDVAMDEQV